MNRRGIFSLLLGAAAFAAGLSSTTFGSMAQDIVGVTDTEIRIGQTSPYSGPLSFLGANGQGDVAFFKWVNDEGGINGRKVNLISLDNGYSPPKTLEQTRKLVEQDEVAFMYRSLGTGPNMAIAKYLNERKVPNIFLAAGVAQLFKPAETPWLLPYNVRYIDEGRIAAKYILKTKPDAKVAVLYQNDDLGGDFLEGLKEGLGDKADAMIVRTATFEVTDPSVDSQVISLAETKADILYMATSANRPITQSIRKSSELGWKPTYMIPSLANVVDVVLKPAGLEKAIGAITFGFLKNPAEPMWKDDPEVVAMSGWMDKYLPGADKTNPFYHHAFYVGSMLKHVLEKAGNDLTRENILKQSTGITGMRFPLLLPGITVNLTPEDYRSITQLQVFEFDGASWQPVGDVVSAND